jgi:hypothetical protein
VNWAALKPFSELRAIFDELRQTPGFTRSDAEARAAVTQILSLRATSESVAHELIADLQQIARHLLQVINPDGRDGFDPNAVDRQFVTHIRDPKTGMLVGRFQLDAHNGAWFEAALHQFAHRTELRHEPTADGETTITAPERTPGQLAADALGDICQAALRSDSTGTAPGNERPRIVITTGLDTLTDALNESRTEAEPTGATESTGPAPGDRRGLLKGVAAGVGGLALAEFSARPASVVAGSRPRSPPPGRGRPPAGTPPH